MTDTVTGECSRCGEYKQVRWSNDPFTAEIHPEADNPYGWWCDDCYQEALWEI